MIDLFMKAVVVFWTVAALLVSASLFLHCWSRLCVTQYNLKLSRMRNGDFIFRTVDHPLAGGRLPKPTDRFWSLIIPLEHGGDICLQLGPHMRHEVLDLLADHEEVED